MRVVAVQKNSDGDIAKFKLDNGQVIEYWEAINGAQDGSIDNLIAQSGRDGSMIVRSKPDGDSSNNLDSMPTFDDTTTQVNTQQNNQMTNQQGNSQQGNQTNNLPYYAPLGSASSQPNMGNNARQNNNQNLTNKSGQGTTLGNQTNRNTQS